MRSRTLVTAGIALFALAGCSSTITGAAGPQGAAAQGGGGQDSGTAQIASVADLGDVVRHNANAKDSVHFASSITLPGTGALTATGDIRFAGGQPAARMTMDMPGVGEMQMITAGNVVYAKLPSELAGALGQPGKPWTKIDLSGTAGAALGSTANMADEMDPTKLIDQIKSAGTITRVSQEQVNGVPATHYSIDVNVAKLARSMTDNEAEKQALSSVNVPNVPFDVWVDPANLPVRIVTNMFYTGQLSSTPEQMTTTTNYSDWGEQVSISAPPADQVGTMGG